MLISCDCEHLTNLAPVTSHAVDRISVEAKACPGLSRAVLRVLDHLPKGSAPRYFKPFATMLAVRLLG